MRKDLLILAYILFAVHLFTDIKTSETIWFVVGWLLYDLFIAFIKLANSKYGTTK